jgi:hypothetical protein
VKSHRQPQTRPQTWLPSAHVSTGVSQTSVQPSPVQVHAELLEQVSAHPAP